MSSFKATPRHAILFKTHFWDGFAARQFHRLRERSAEGDVFILFDETRSERVDIPYGRVLRMTEETSESEGFFRYPRNDAFWYNTDYQLYHFLALHDEYDFIFMVEYDVVVNVDIGRIADFMAEHELDFVGEPVRTPMSDWNWAHNMSPYYDKGADFGGQLICFAGFGRQFGHHLARARRALSAKARLINEAHGPGDRIRWPNNEGFVGTEIKRVGARTAPLSAFGNVSRYDWSPPSAEFELNGLRDCAFVHPVLDGPRFFAGATAKLGWKLEDLFMVGSPVETRMAACDLQEFLGFFLRHFILKRDLDSIARLRLYAQSRTGVAGDDDLFNVARGKPATQSSVCKWSRNATAPSLDAAGAVNGRITGSYNFHTDSDEPSWWMVDLELACPIKEIRVFNRLDLPERANSLVISGSTDLLWWRVLYDHSGSPAFGGLDGNPLKAAWRDAPYVRFIRLHLADRQPLTLDQIQVLV